jgi:hypothetical protein
VTADDDVCMQTESGEACERDRTTLAKTLGKDAEACRFET